MWARAALAVVFICYGINWAQAIFVRRIEPMIRLEANPKFARMGQSGSFNFKAKFCSMAGRTAENIVIFNPSPNIPAVIRCDLFYLGSINAIKRSMNFTIRTDKPIAEQFRIWKFEIVRQWYRHLTATCIDNYIGRRSLAAISQYSGKAIAI